MEKLLLGLTLIFIVTYLWYVSLIKKRNTVLEALSGIDVQLTKRVELVLNILEIAKKVMVHETLLLTQITELYTRLSHDYHKADPSAVKEHFVLAEGLNDKMGVLMLNVDNYPELRSDNTMLQVMQTYNEIEVHIAAVRRFYNSAVVELNTAVEVFPGSIIASLASIDLMPFYEVSDVVNAPIDAAEYL
ncbi:MAG: LemA family protein [Shewanella sp.]